MSAMASTLPPEKSGGATLAAMNAAAYDILVAGVRGYEDIYQPFVATTGYPSPRVGFAYDQASGLGKGKKAVEQFTDVFFGPGSPNLGGLLLLNQLTEEFTDVDDRKIESFLPPGQQKVTGHIQGNLLYKLVEPPPEIIRERNFILYSYVGHVMVRGSYNVEGSERIVAHPLLSLSRNAYSPQGYVPVVRVGVPTRSFNWANDSLDR